MSHVRITVVKKACHQDLLETYLADAQKERGFGICTAFEEGQTFEVERLQPPEGFCPWAWSDIQRDVAMVQFGTGYPWVGPENTAISCCTDGFRPVTFKIERVDEAKA